MTIDGYENRVKTASFIGFLRGIVIYGDNNNVSSVAYKYKNTTNLTHHAIPVYVSGGSGNTVRGIKNLDYDPAYPCYSFVCDETKGIDNHVVPENNVFINCGPGKVILGGNKNKMHGVDCGVGKESFLMIKGFGHHLENCKYSKFLNQSPVSDIVFVNCNSKPKAAQKARWFL